jgi:peptidoglycan/xylan/chitin deacetylase (PgdA/CDA1 family)
LIITIFAVFFGFVFFYYFNQVGSLFRLFKEENREYLSGPAGQEKENAAPEQPFDIINAKGVKVPIIVYHSVRPYYFSDTKFVKQFIVEPAVFERQMNFLRDNGYVAISFNDLLNLFEKGKPMPTKPVIINFDDGWENQYLNAFPILKDKKFIAAFFVYTNSLGHEKFMTWDEVKELSRAGMAIGSHTETHPYLFKISDPAVLKKEISGSKQILEERLGEKINLFSYPYGQYSEKLMALVKESGYEAARGLAWGLYQKKEDKFNFKCFLVTNDFNKFVSILNK